MKKNEMIYRAIGGISEEKAADAYLYTSEKQKNYRLRTVFSGVGIAAIVCSFFVLSFVLLKVSGPKTGPAASGEISNTEEQTEAEITTYPFETVVREGLIEAYSITFEEIYKKEPYCELLPTRFPKIYDEMVPLKSNFLEYEEGYSVKDLLVYSCQFSTNTSGIYSDFDYMKDSILTTYSKAYDQITLSVAIKKSAKHNIIKTPEKVTVSDIQKSIDDQSFTYRVCYGDYYVVYTYLFPVGTDPSRIPTAEEFYDMISSTPAFNK